MQSFMFLDCLFKRLDPPPPLVKKGLHQIVDQLGIKIKTSITGGKESNQIAYVFSKIKICLNQDERTSSVHKTSLPNLPVLFLSLKINMLLKNNVNVLKNHKTVFKANFVKYLDLLT